MALAGRPVAPASLEPAFLSDTARFTSRGQPCSALGPGSYDLPKGDFDDVGAKRFPWQARSGSSFGSSSPQRPRAVCPEEQCKPGPGAYNLAAGTTLAGRSCDKYDSHCKSFASTSSRWAKPPGTPSVGPGTYDHQPTDFVAVASANATIPDSAFATRAGRSAAAAASRQQGDMPGPGTYDLATPPLSAVVRGANSIKEHTSYGQAGYGPLVSRAPRLPGASYRDKLPGPGHYSPELPPGSPSFNQAGCTAPFNRPHTAPVPRPTAACRWAPARQLQALRRSTPGLPAAPQQEGGPAAWATGPDWTVPGPGQYGSPAVSRCGTALAWGGVPLRGWCAKGSAAFRNSGHGERGVLPEGAKATAAPHAYSSPKEWLAQGPHRPAGTFGPHSPAELPPASHTSLLVARLQHALAAGAAAASANEGAGCADGCEADSAALGFRLARVAQHVEDDDKPGPGTYDLDMALSLSADVARAVAAGSSAGFKSSVLTDGLSSPRQDRQDSAGLGPGQYEVAARRVAIDPGKGTIVAFRSTSPGRREVAEREAAFRAPGPAAYNPKTAPARQSFHVPPAVRARIMQQVASQCGPPQPRSKVPSHLPVAPLAA